MSRTHDAVNELNIAVEKYLASCEVALLSGADASEALSLLVPALRQLSFRSIAIGARAVAANQHTEEHSRSGAEWLASKLHISERAAGSRLAAHNRMAANPDVYDLVESGSLSFEKGALIARMAAGSDDITQELLPFASSNSYAQLQQRSNDIVAKLRTQPEQEKQRRNSQYLNIIDKPNNMVKLELYTTRSVAAAWLALWNANKQKALWANQALDDPLPVNAALAEGFSAMFSESGGSSNPVLNYHIDLDAWLDDSELVELAGVGLVPRSLVEALEHPALALLIRSKNKLIWYSEAKYKADGRLPEFIKRAVKANQRHTCAGDGCTDLAHEVDHNQSRNRQGLNDFQNLQGLCDPDHDVKTKHDAPWTQGGIFGKKKPKAKGPPLADTG